MYSKGHIFEPLEKHQNKAPCHVCDFLGYFYIISCLDEGQNNDSSLFELLGQTDLNYFYYY